MPSELTETQGAILLHLQEKGFYAQSRALRPDDAESNLFIVIKGNDGTHRLGINVLIDWVELCDLESTGYCQEGVPERPSARV